MTLEEIFGAGHFVALGAGGGRFVVQAPAPPAPIGWWLVREKALPAIVYKQAVRFQDLGGTLGEVDMRSTDWRIDDASCWCRECSASRKMSETQSD